MLMQASKPAIPVKALNYFALEVSDMKRSIDFYQGLFGMPVQLRRDGGVLLRIGNGPQFVSIMPAGSNPPRIVPNVGMTVENFNADRLVGALLQHGVTKAEPSDPGLSGGPMKVRVRMQDRTAELFLGDPDGLVIQLQDPRRGAETPLQLWHFTERERPGPGRSAEIVCEPSNGEPRRCSGRNPRTVLHRSGWPPDSASRRELLRRRRISRQCL
jgi:catechol 2,3-dioxygenase-like lactoylglutathione lyase family enzyme